MDTEFYHSGSLCSHDLYRYAAGLITHVRNKHPFVYEGWAGQRQRARLDGTTNLDHVLEADLAALAIDSDEEEEDDEQVSDADSPDEEMGELQLVDCEHRTRGNGCIYGEEAIPKGVEIPQPTPRFEARSSGPFKTEAEFELARWFINHNVSKTAIYSYFSLCKRFLDQFHSGSFTSAHTLLKAVDLMPIGIDP